MEFVCVKIVYAFVVNEAYASNTTTRTIAAGKEGEITNKQPK